MFLRAQRGMIGARGLRARDVHHPSSVNLVPLERKSGLLGFRATHESKRTVPWMDTHGPIRELCMHAC